MNNAQRKTLEQVFANPINGNLEWRKIEAFGFIGLIRNARHCATAFQMRVVFCKKLESTHEHHALQRLQRPYRI